MVEITWLGHSTFQLRLPSGEVLLTDPWVDGNPSYPQGHAIERLDVLVLSHGHFDHSGDAVRLARQFSPQVVAIYEIGQWLEDAGVSNVNSMNKGGSLQVGPVTLTMTHAIHSSAMLEGGKLTYGGEAAGYVIRFADGRSAYFAGDTTVFSDMALIRELYEPELCFLPIGDRFTMGPREAAVACRLLQPKRVIPMHWGTFPLLTGTPAALAGMVRQLGVEVWELTPGKPAAW
ncbi:MAG: metal-dependent hydrolase [Bryobacteraceae bacterium]